MHSAFAYSSISLRFNFFPILFFSFFYFHFKDLKSLLIPFSYVSPRYSKRINSETGGFQQRGLIS